MLDWEILAARWVLGDVSGDEVVVLALRQLEGGSTSVHWLVLSVVVGPTRGSVELGLIATVAQESRELAAAYEVESVRVSTAGDRIDLSLLDGERTYSKEADGIRVQEAAFLMI
ncbi:MAG: hypothetical protein DHS20C21_02880 [Gemmatimonadota bacterium]|nr:MAG: hypothetical protein DHS20C21_02880 [Gemmatimonadota bacterium]